MSKQAVADFWKRLDEDEKMKDEFFSTVPQNLETGAPIVKFAHEHGFEFTEEELQEAAAVVGAKAGGGELADRELEGVAGGASYFQYPSGSTGYRVLSSFSKLQAGGSVML